MEQPDISYLPQNLIINTLPVIDYYYQVQNDFYFHNLLSGVVNDVVEMVAYSAATDDMIVELMNQYSFYCNEYPEGCYQRVCDYIWNLGNYLVEQFKVMRTYALDDVLYYTLLSFSPTTIVLTKTNGEDFFCNLN